MQSRATCSPARVLASLLILCSFVSAHSWVELLRLIGANGTFTGAPGYPRGYYDRDTMGTAYNDKLMQWLITDPTTAPMCKPDSQQPGPPRNASFPRLVASPDSSVALLYQENGHVTLPQNQLGKPANRGTVYIYGTDDPKANEQFSAIHKVWNTEGTGGDKRGKLLSAQNFDDGQCYQVNGGDISTARQKEFPVGTPMNPFGTNVWCQNNLVLPTDTPTGKPYTLYWVWDWPTAPGVDPNDKAGKNETYTTCMDMDMTAANGSSSGLASKAAAAKFVAGQPVQNAGVPSYVSNLSGGKNIMVTTPQGNAGTPAAASSAAAPPPSSAAAAAAPPATSAAAQGSSSAAPSIVPIPASGPAVPPLLLSTSSAASPSSAAPAPSSQAPVAEASGGTLYVYPVSTIWATQTSLPAGYGAMAATSAVAASGAPVASSVSSAATLAVSSATLSAAAAAAPSSSASSSPSASAAGNSTECATPHQKRSRLFRA